MKNEFTFLSYICSKDKRKLTEFVRKLPLKIEIKSITFGQGKWHVWFNLADHLNPKQVKFKDIDLDQGGF